MVTPDPPTRWLLRLAYDGTDFAGCPPLPDRRTVCGTLAQALGRVGLEPVEVETLSRTDAGVHARGNVGHVVLPREIDADALLHILDRHLPDDLRCHGVRQVGVLPATGAKTYRYTLDASAFGDPSVARTAWRPSGPVTRADLAPLADLLVGTRDWGAFRRTGETRDDLVRTVHEADWTAEDDRLVFTIRGAGFPYRLVRSLVGGMVAVARGGASPEAWAAALDGTLTPAARQTAPAHGLCLIEIEDDDGAPLVPVAAGP